jgi:glycosyltransferase involved in cell wall biosynthesis
VTLVHVVVPDGIDDPGRPSGGNAYDRRVCRDLPATGWTVCEHAVAGPWPEPDDPALVRLAEVVAGLPEGAVVLVDGLVASASAAVLVPQAARLRLVVLLHMPSGGTQECAVLSAAAAVVTTSGWGREWVLERYPLSPGDVHVAQPGVDAADLAPGSASGGHLLCVATVTPAKGHDALLGALADVADLPWRCECVGSVTRDPGYVDGLLRQAREAGISERVGFTGACTASVLDASYAAADLLVLATRVESFGMVVCEALARGLPVLATAVGGVPEALGRLPDGGRPGLLVPPDDPGALAAALRAWLGDHDLRATLRRAARARRSTLSPWSATSDRISRVLARVAR